MQKFLELNFYRALAKWANLNDNTVPKILPILIFYFYYAKISDLISMFDDKRLN